MARLIWKEWHEQRWKLGFASLILSAFVLIGLRARIIADETVINAVCVIGIVLLPILSSMGLTPAERGEGSLNTLLALPISVQRIFSAKMLIGLLLCAGPLLSAAIVTLAMAGGRELPSGAIIGIYLRSAAATVSLFVWMAALTVRLPDEARAGLLALGILVLWMLVSAAFIEIPGMQAFWITSPFAFALDFEMYKFPHTWIGSSHVTNVYTLKNVNGTVYISAVASILVQTAIAAALWFFAARRLATHSEDRT